MERCHAKNVGRYLPTCHHASVILFERKLGSKILKTGATGYLFITTGNIKLNILFES